MSNTYTENGDFWGAEANDIYVGDDNDNWIEGGAGDDTLSGGAGNDGIDGGAGNDVIDGGAGHDWLVGGAGADVFVFGADSGHDEIVDFTMADHDQLDLSAYADQKVTISQVGANVSITLGDSASVTLENVDLADLTAENFIGVNPLDADSKPHDGGDDYCPSDVGTPNGKTVMMEDVWFAQKPDAPLYVDLSIDKTIENVSANYDYVPVGDDHDWAFGDGVVKYTITVTNNSEHSASEIVVRDETPENLDVWKGGESTITSETGAHWNNNTWGTQFTGNPTSSDTSNGTVTVTEAEFLTARSHPLSAGQDYGLNGGEILWELGGTLEAGESATLTYYGMRAANGGYDFAVGTKFETTAKIISAKEHLINEYDDQDTVINQWISPIALDLNGDGKIGVTGATTSIDKDPNAELGRTVEFDLDADGKIDTIEWLSGDGDGLLVDNRDGNAANDMDGARLFGDQGGLYANGFEKLALLDANHDGVLNGEELNGLELWVDDGDAVVEAGELQDLAHNRIYSLNVEMKEEVNERGETLMRSTAESSAPDITGTDYDDSLWRTNAPENMYGGDGDDWVEGAGGDDCLFGGAGNDGIDGGVGDDEIDGGAGHDWLVGGAGADTFIFQAEFGHDEIVDFNTYEGDTPDLSAFNQADMTVVQDGADAIIHVANAGAVYLLGVDASELNMDAYA